MTREEMIKRIDDHILTVSDGRRDICTIYRDAELMDAIVTDIANKYSHMVDYVAAPESLGFILGSLLSAKLGVGFIPIRNGDIAVLPSDDSIRSSYIDHRDQARTLQVRKSNLPKKSRILLVDDWIETCSTHHACKDIIDEARAELVGIATVGCSKNRRTSVLLGQGMLYCIVQK